MIVREEVDKKVKKPFIYKYVIDQDALPAFVASGKDMRYFKGMRYLLSYSKFLKEDRTINREPEQSETILEEECSNIENDGIPIVPQIMPISSSVGSGDPYYQYGGGYIYPSYYLYPTYTYPKTSNDSQTNNTTPNNPVTGVYGTNAPTTSITSGGVDPQLNTGYPTYSNDYGGSFGNTTYNYNFILDDNGVVNISNLDGGGGASCIQINIAYYGNYMFISVSSCNLMQYYAQRTALLDPDCPDPQGTIGVLPPEDPCPIAGYTKDVNGNCLEDDKIYIDPSFQNSKANCVYKLLGEQDGLKNIISKLIPENSPYNLTWKVTKDLKNLEGNKVNGLTDGSYDTNFKDILIVIDKDFAETTTFPYLATIIVHEAIHAKLFEMIKSVGGLDNLKQFTNETTEFGKLWAYYDKYKVTYSWQHELMYGNYLKNIGDAVENFHKTYYLEDYTKFHNNMSTTPYYDKSTFYENIAAYGLRNTTQFPKDQLLNTTLLVEDLKINSKANTCID